MTQDRVSADAILRSPNGVVSRRVVLIGGKPPRWLELRDAEVTNLYLLAVNDPVRPVYRWLARQSNG